jgi:hypothetical protein
MLSGGISGPLLSFTVPLGESPIVPNGLGIVNFTSSGGTVAITGSSASPNNHTINFDLAGGGIGLDSFQVQAATAPGVNPVTPTALGLVNVNATTVANHSVPIETRTRALNTYNIEAQIAASSATTDATKNGLSHYDSNAFSVDANGFVSLVTPSGGFSSIVIRTFTASGTYTPTAGMKYAIIEVNGAGGGGGGTSTVAVGNCSVGGGGAAGGYARSVVSAATVGASQVVTVGVGGTAGPANNVGGIGGTGGTTSVGALCVATGGLGGFSANVNSVQITGGGAGGIGTVGNVLCSANSGGFGVGFTTANLCIGGQGGVSKFGAGANTQVSSTSSLVGTTPSGFGGGGGGASTPAAQLGQIGGVGASGLVIITEFI